MKRLIIAWTTALLLYGCSPERPVVAPVNPEASPEACQLLEFLHSLRGKYTLAGQHNFIFYSHRFDPVTPLEETLQALVDIVRSGKALYVGISRYPLEAARFAFRYLAERDVPCLLFQDRYNIFDREPETSGVLSLAAESGAGFIAFSPLAQGLLTNRYLNGIPQDSRMAVGGSLKRDDLTEEKLSRIRALNDLARQRGQTLAEMALAWLLRDERVSSVIIGASSVAQIEENLKALRNTTFSAEELAEIDRLSIG